MCRGPKLRKQRGALMKAAYLFFTLINMMLSILIIAYQFEIMELRAEQVCKTTDAFFVQRVGP